MPPKCGWFKSEFMKKKLECQTRASAKLYRTQTYVGTLCNSGDDDEDDEMAFI